MNYTKDKSERVFIRISKELKERLKTKKISVSEVCRKALERAAQKTHSAD